MNFLRYDPADGAILQASDMPQDGIDHLVATEGWHVIAGEGDPKTHYVLGGEIITFNPTQAARRAAAPAYPARWDMGAMAWVDLRDLATVKAAKWAEIQIAEQTANAAGVTWDGSKFDSDAKAQRNLTSAVVLGANVPGYTVSWTLFDNSSRTLSFADLVEVGTLVGALVQANHNRAQTLRAAIAAATDAAGVAAIVWSAA